MDRQPENIRFKPFYIGFLVFMALSFTVNLNTAIFDILARDAQTPILHPIIWETTGHFTAIVFFPLLFYIVRPLRRPFRKGRSSHLVLWVLLHIGLGFVYTVLQTSVFYGLRVVVFRWMDLGEYQYGNLFFRYLFEFHKLIIAYWLLLGVMRLVDYVQENKQKEIRTERLKNQWQEARLQSLNMQLNPHFLFNTLNTISATMYENVRDADHMLVLLSDMLRRTLNLTAARIPLSQELTMLSQYIRIMKARFGDQLAVVIQQEKNMADALVPPLILQPLVENAIKYAPPDGRTTHILVAIKKENQNLCIEVADNGEGLPADFKKGVGLQNIASRLETLYGENQQLAFEAQTQGVLARMTFPFEVCIESTDC